MYFLVALAVKAPAALQILLVCGLVLLAMQIRKRRFDWSNLFWIIPPVLYIGLASLSSLQLGVRLILPALPFGLLLCGAAVEWLLRGRRKLVLFCLLAWLAVESLSVYPRGISFFNTWVGGPHNGLRYLADSNLDWGQDLAALAEHVRRHGIEKIRLSYFGIDSVQRYFRDDEVEFTPSPWFGAHAVKDRLRPEPGFYAISASLLPGHYFPERYRDYYKAFREMEPVAKAGYSIYIYRVDR